MRCAVGHAVRAELPQVYSKPSRFPRARMDPVAIAVGIECSWNGNRTGDCILASLIWRLRGMCIGVNCGGFHVVADPSEMVRGTDVPFTPYYSRIIELLIGDYRER